MSATPHTTGGVPDGTEAIGSVQSLTRVYDNKANQAVRQDDYFNLSGVTYLDSGGLGTLVGVYSSARASGADIKLTGLGQRLRDVLQITKLVTVFEVYDTEQEAIGAFHRGAA